MTIEHMFGLGYRVEHDERGVGIIFEVADEVEDYHVAWHNGGSSWIAGDEFTKVSYPLWIQADDVEMLDFLHQEFMTEFPCFAERASKAHVMQKNCFKRLHAMQDQIVPLLKRVRSFVN